MTRTGNAAQTYALAQYGKKIVPGLCLKNTRITFDVPAKYPTAKAAWANTDHHSGEPPKGAVVPVWFDHSKYGHVATHLADGRVITVNGDHWSIYSSVQALAKAWKTTYLGWSTHLNGVKVYDPKPAPPAHSSQVAKVQAFTNKVFPAYSKLVVDGVKGPATTGVLKEFQKRTGIPRTGDIDSATLRELAKFGYK